MSAWSGVGRKTDPSACEGAKVSGHGSGDADQDYSLQWPGLGACGRGISEALEFRERRAERWCPQLPAARAGLVASLTQDSKTAESQPRVSKGQISAPKARGSKRTPALSGAADTFPRSLRRALPSSFGSRPRGVRADPQNPKLGD